MPPDFAETLPQLAHLKHGIDRRLLVGVRDKLAVDHVPPVGTLAAAVSATLFHVLLHLADALADAVPLVLGDGGEDREHELADAVVRHVAAEIDHVERHAIVAERLERYKRVRGVPEHAVHLWRDQNVAEAQRRY